MAHPSFKTGQHVRAGRFSVPKALEASYASFLSQKEELLSAFDEMALLGARVQALLDDIERVGGGAATGEFFQRWDALVVALAGKNPVRIREAIEACAMSVDAMRSSAGQWLEIYGLLDLLRKQRTTEVRRIQVEREFASVHQMRSFLAASQTVILDVCALAPTKELEWEMRNLYEAEMRRVLAQPIVGS